MKKSAEIKLSDLKKSAEIKLSTGSESLLIKDIYRMQSNKPMTVRNNTSALNKPGERNARTRSKTPSKANATKIAPATILPSGVHDARGSQDSSIGNIKSLKTSVVAQSGVRGNNLVNKYLRASGTSRVAAEKISPEKCL